MKGWIVVDEVGHLTGELAELARNLGGALRDLGRVGAFGAAYWRDDREWRRRLRRGRESRIGDCLVRVPPGDELEALRELHRLLGDYLETTDRLAEIRSGVEFVFGEGIEEGIEGQNGRGPSEGKAPRGRFD